MAIVVWAFCSWLEKNENCYFIVNWNHDQFNELKSAPLFSAFFEAFSESDPFIPASSVKRHEKSLSLLLLLPVGQAGIYDTTGKN